MKPFHGLLGSAIALACTLAVAGCDSSTSERTAGGEDFPNTLEALGRALAEAVDSTDSWSGLQESSLPTSSSEGLPDTAKLLAGRRAALLCEPDTTWGSLVDGFLFQRSIRCPDGGRVQDSLVIRPSDSLVRILVRDSSGLLGLVRKVETFQADSGEGFKLKGYPGRIRMGTVGTKGRWRLESELVLDAGPDLDWDSDRDNGLHRGGQATIRDGRDTLDRWTVLPWPSGLGPIYSSRGGDSGLALMERRQILASGARRAESSVLMAFRADSMNYPLRSRTTTTWPGSAILEESIRGKGPDSLFSPGDSAWYVRRWKDGADSLREEIVLRTSSSPREREGHRFLALSSVRHRSRAQEVDVAMRAVPASPLVPGAEFTDGTVEIVVGRSNGESIRFQGTMASGVTTGRWSTGRDSGTVRLSADGKVLGTGP
jgi:hypothetical protein